MNKTHPADGQGSERAPATPQTATRRREAVKQKLGSHAQVTFKTSLPVVDADDDGGSFVTCPRCRPKPGVCIYSQPRPHQVMREREREGRREGEREEGRERERDCRRIGGGRGQAGVQLVSETRGWIH